jgi:hypothetical protein
MKNNPMHSRSAMRAGCPVNAANHLDRWGKSAGRGNRRATGANAAILPDRGIWNDIVICRASVPASSLRRAFGKKQSRLSPRMDSGLLPPSPRLRRTSRYARNDGWMELGLNPATNPFDTSGKTVAKG